MEGPLGKHAMESAIHYHIVWPNSVLDWKPLPTKEEAMHLAQLIKKPNENYTIVERDDECERCNLFASKAAIQGREP